MVHASVVTHDPSRRLPSVYPRCISGMKVETLPSESELESLLPSDAETIQEVLKGDSRAFEHIVRVYQARVFGFLRQMTKHRQDAEDLTQQTFLKAYQNLSRFDLSRPMVNWLLTIARNSAINHLRTLRPSEAVPDHLPSAEASPAQMTEERDRQKNLWDRVRAILPARQFEILWLRYGEDLSVRETAEVSGLTQTHVKILVFRARHTLLKQNLHL
jgi:RNA polymerase sigma-70 factor (ECF subfamily)